MADKYVISCPYCGGTEIIETYQGGYGAIVATCHQFGGVALYHSVCRKCGSVVRSYVKDPEKLLKKKDRRYNTNAQKKNFCRVMYSASCY